MIFEIHKERKISYKRLTDADLNRGDGHQTHIGLSIDSLTFMPNNKKEYSAMLIYKEYCDILNCEIAKIHRKSGRYNAPKISMGNKPIKLVRKVRDFAREAEDKKFYLLWFGLDSLTPVFWLIEEGSYDFSRLDEFCNFSSLPDKTIVVLDQSDLAFSNILQYIQSRLENVTIDLKKDLELSVELEADNPKFKDTEVKKAISRIQEIGKLGEALVDEYLDRKKSDKIISTYEWMNKSGEKGKPFDFYINYSNGLEQWVDVKSTEFEFEQPVIISKNEMKFIKDKHSSSYAIFRVYSINELKAKLRVCSECLKYIKKLYRDIDYMTLSMKDYNAALVNYKISFEPGPVSFNSISDEIAIYHQTT